MNYGLKKWGWEGAASDKRGEPKEIHGYFGSQANTACFQEEGVSDYLGQILMTRQVKWVPWSGYWI